MCIWSEWPGAHASIGVDMGCSNCPKGNVAADFSALVISQKVRNSCHHGMARAGVFGASALSALALAKTKICAEKYAWGKVVHDANLRIQ
jgi:hypothetical protein